jgi:hypothetical protein
VWEKELYIWINCVDRRSRRCCVVAGLVMAAHQVGGDRSHGETNISAPLSALDFGLQVIVDSLDAELGNWETMRTTWRRLIGVNSLC